MVVLALYVQVPPSHHATASSILRPGDPTRRALFLAHLDPASTDFPNTLLSYSGRYCHTSTPKAHSWRTAVSALLEISAQRSTWRNRQQEDQGSRTRKTSAPIRTQRLPGG